jgi:ribosomal protein L7/L12
MAKISTDDLLEAFKEMTLLELSEFVKQFEETFDVKASGVVLEPDLLKRIDEVLAPVIQRDPELTQSPRSRS